MNQRRRHPRGSSALTLLAAITLVGGIILITSSVRASDDIDLLRINGGQPYVYFIIDTSGSMVLDQNDNWVPASGDDPGITGSSDRPTSKFYGIKKAIYDVIKAVPQNVHLGLAGFNQDQLHVTAKHWLYHPTAPATLATGLTYPASTDENWVFGKHINATGEAGTCDAPLSLGSNLAKINDFPRLGVAGLSQTTLWISGTGGETYQVLVSLSPTSTGNLGDSSILVHLQANLVNDCSPLDVTDGTPVDVAFNLERDFLMVESNGPAGLSTTNCTDEETMTGPWGYTDVVADNTCGVDSGGPFTGLGWDGNSDAADRPPWPSSISPTPQPDDNLDPCCVDPASPGVCKDPKKINYNRDNCVNLRFPTALHPQYLELDKGDEIPLNWSASNKDDFLKRLNPKYPNGEDFGIASYFQDQPDSETGLLHLKDDNEKPLIAFGHSPLGRSIVDFRCWYLGGGPNKCKSDQFDPGWEQLFHDNDVNYNCRVPYLIIVSDGEDNGTRENAAADVANLNTKSGVRTFVFTFKSTAQLHSIVQNGKGDLILVDSSQQLEDELRKVIGVIEESAKTFASAAVPSVQSAVEDKIYLTNFTPLDKRGYWDGHLHSFLKPLPIDPLTGQPDTNDPNHRWDAGQVMLAQAPDYVDPASDTSSVDLQLGDGLDQRRVYYSEEARPDNALAERYWPGNRKLFDRTTTDFTVSPAPSPSDQEVDFWKGLGISFILGDVDSEKAAQRAANKVVETALIEKEYTSAKAGTLDYILGDIFHSNPLIVGGPVNTKYFIDDAEETYNNGVPQGTGYQDFFLKHENRRKLVVAGANDGMLHAWDAGKAAIETITDDSGIERDVVHFDSGTGRELFAYIPRPVLPTVNKLATPGQENHYWSVDGSPVAGDVFIDPRGTGTPDPAKRAWRTVVIDGLREGGNAYFALDITQPDELVKTTIGPTAPGSEREDVTVPVDQGVVPDCANLKGDGKLGCDEDLKYPATLWEFSDQVWDASGKYVPLDEDGNGFADLGETWSKPDIGRIRVVENGEVVNKYVAIFGGGLDKEAPGSRGNFLYILDIETGQPIYKRPVLGSVPSDPAAVDTNQDGYINRVYFGTTAGAMYRLDLEDDSKSGNDRYPTLTTDPLRGGSALGINGITYDVTRIEKTDAGGNPVWEPKEIFSTCDPSDATLCRPIYYPPTVLFVAKLGRYALGLGTGDRSDLTSGKLAGRFYLFVDDSDLAGVKDSLPLDESNLHAVALTDAANTDLLTTGSPGHRGWYLVLNSKERLISNPFGLTGVTFFATFVPDDPKPTCTVTETHCDNPMCSLGGQSYVYVVETTTANPLLYDATDQLTRTHEVHGFVTEPFTEQGLTKNSTSGSGTGTGTDDSADKLTPREINIMNNLKSLFPENCKFGNHRIDIKLIAADTHVERIAPVPICIIEKNWKEVAQ